MKKILYIVLTLLVAALAASCGSGKFEIDGNLTDAGTQNIRAVYLSGDTIISQWVPAVGGVFRIEGQVSDLTVVYVFTSQMRPVTCVAVDAGDKITLKGSISDCYNISLTGNDVCEGYSKFLAGHAKEFRTSQSDKTDKAIADYIAKNPGNPVSTLLLTCNYSDLSSDAARKLLDKIKKSAKPEQLLSLYQMQLSGKAPAAKRLNALKLRNERDSLTMVKTLGHSATLLYFWSADDTDHSAAVRRLRPNAGKRLQIVDVCLDSDTVRWRSVINSDSVTWPHYKAVTGVVDSSIADLDIKRSPWFIVADSTGRQAYRGTSVDDALSAAKKITK